MKLILLCSIIYLNFTHTIAKLLLQTELDKGSNSEIVSAKIVSPKSLLHNKPNLKDKTLSEKLGDDQELNKDLKSVILREKRGLTSIQRKPWWPFKRNRFQNIDYYNDCDYYDYYDSYDYGPSPPCGRGPGNLRPLSGGRRGVKETLLLEDQIRLKEEIRRLKQRRQESVKKVHHHHGPTKIGSGVPKPLLHPGDPSNSNKQLKKKIEKIEKKITNNQRDADAAYYANDLIVPRPLPFRPFPFGPFGGFGSFGGGLFGGGFGGGLFGGFRNSQTNTGTVNRNRFNLAQTTTKSPVTVIINNPGK